MAERAALVEVLRAAQVEGLAGPGPVEPHIDHAVGFADVAGDPPDLGLDLGSGAGLPGLVLALVWPSSSWVLLDGRRRSTEFLEVGARRLDVDSRVRVVGARAEEAAHRDLRGTVELVTARGMGPPATTAECAAGFLRVGGRLVVSEPPEARADRWNASSLRVLGMEGPKFTQSAGGAHFAVSVQQALCPARFPRRTGQPEKRPLF